jgi:hypothetical protein
VLQLYEMLAVRHGIMVVGLPLAGKSAVLATLAAALGALAAAGESGPLFERVDAVAINPKAVTMEELYGAGDRATQEWRVRARQGARRAHHAQRLVMSVRRVTENCSAAAWYVVTCLSV